MLHHQQWILITLAVLLLMPACAAAGQTTPTPVSWIPGLPLPTENPDAMAVDEATETTAKPAEAAQTGEAEPMTPEPNTEAVEAALSQEEATIKATGEAEEEAALSDEEQINRGEEIYGVECAKCHQLNGRGRGEAFPALAGSAVATVEDAAPAIEIVLNGGEVMPSFKDKLSAKEIASVLSYVRKAWGNNASAVTTEQVRQVQASGEPESETAQEQ